MTVLIIGHSLLEVRPSTKNQAKTINLWYTKSLIRPSVPEVFHGSREPYKASGTRKSLILPSVPEGFKNPENPINPLVHLGVSYSQVYQRVSKIQRPP